MALTDEEYVNTMHFVDRMELRRLELDKEYELQMSREEAETEREALRKRTNVWQSFYTALSVMTAGMVVLGVVYISWQASKGPGAGEELDKEFKMSCIQQGGTYLSDGTCVAHGAGVEKNPQSVPSE